MRALRCLVTLALWSGASHSAIALEIFGLKLFEDQADRDAEAVIADPQPYSIEFASGAEGQLDAAIRGASALLADQDRSSSGTAGLVAKARGDYRRIIGALYGEGYYGGTVNILIGGVEAARLAPDSGLPDPVSVRIVVDPGPVFSFADLRITNRAPAAADPGDAVDDPEGLGFVSGNVARSTIIARAEGRLLDAWREQGFPKATIAGREVIADHSNNTVDVAIVVDPGGRAGIGDVAVTGTEHMNPDFVRRQSGLTPGEEYDPDAIERAHKRLSRLEVFRALRLEAAQAIGDDGLLPYAIFVEEQKLHRFGVGATFSTIEGLGVEGF